VLKHFELHVSCSFESKQVVLLVNFSRGEAVQERLGVCFKQFELHVNSGFSQPIFLLFFELQEAVQQRLGMRVYAACCA
jgi:hypothetical protein